MAVQVRLELATLALVLIWRRPFENCTERRIAREAWHSAWEV